MIRVKVVQRQQAAEGITALYLEREDGQPLPSFDPGAHIDLFLSDGLIRQYSLCGAQEPGAPYRIAVALDPRSRGGSIQVHKGLIAGSEVQISEPRNLFALDESLEHYSLIAGGIGVTPIISMAMRLHELGKSFTFYYCARSRAAAAFIDELRASPFSEKVRLFFDSETNQSFDLDTVLASPRAGHGLYVCGPTGFMDKVFDRATVLGWQSHNLHREDFSAVVGEKKGDTAFTLVIKSSGENVEVPVGVTAAQALEQAGYFVMLSCEQGICGTCLTPVLDGMPDHRDVFQTDEERAANAQFTPCCSRSMTPKLLVDL